MQEFDTSQLSGRILKVFLAVYDQMSISKAAQQLELSQSTVSHSIEKLRGILGDALFVQSGRGIAPSARAEVLAPKIRRLLAEMTSLVDTGDYSPLADDEPFVIGSNGSVLAHEITRIRDAIWLQVPNKKIVFRELGSRANLETFLDSVSANIAITVRPGAYPQTLNHQALFSDHSEIFYDSACRPQISSVEEYCQARHAALDFGGTSKSLIELALEDRGMSRRVSLRVPNVWLLAQMIKGSDMITTLPAKLKQSAFAPLQSCALPFTQPEIRFDLVWHRRYDNSARMHWLRSLLCKALTDPA